MNNNELIAIYESALNDWNIVINKFNSLEDKSIENIKKVFADQIECNQIFLIIVQGVIKVYLQGNDFSSYVISENFTIETDEFVSPFVTYDDIEKILFKMKLLY